MADTVCMVQRPAHASAALDLRRYYGDGASYLNIHTPHTFIQITYIHT